ncbi:DDE superfamily endonuclease [Popillia japonica]|uniref:DDE superfamily endonuclease n=1 Tax=Popillia japonica TaxID=7064 RepID=A0AAW1KLP5_POPJA
MEEPQFYNWFKDVFILYVKNLREANKLPTQSAILIFDGHSSHSSIRIIEEALTNHSSIRIIEEALTNHIQLVRLPSHLTDRIQPLDKCVFGPLKIKWDKLLVNFGKTQMGQGSCRLTREKFGELLGLTLQQAVTSNIIISGFRNTGLFPVDNSKFSEDMFDPSDLQRYKNLKKRKLSQDILSKSTLNANILLEKSSHSLDHSFSSVTISQQDLPIKSVLTATMVDGSPDINEVALDLSSRIHHPSPVKLQSATRSMVEIFSNVIKKCNKVESNSNTSTSVKGTPRLKCSTYGEVLTTTEVLERLNIGSTLTIKIFDL